MIKYTLVCRKCDHVHLNSWFLNSKEFDRLKKKNLVSCAEFVYFKIRFEKSIMAPSMSRVLTNC